MHHTCNQDVQGGVSRLEVWSIMRRDSSLGPMRCGIIETIGKGRHGSVYEFQVCMQEVDLNFSYMGDSTGQVVQSLSAVT